MKAGASPNFSPGIRLRRSIGRGRIPQFEIRIPQLSEPFRAAEIGNHLPDVAVLPVERVV